MKEFQMVGRGGIYDGMHGDGKPVGEPSEPVRPWGDKPDQFSERIKAAHPVICKDDDRHDRYALAMEMIHSRHSKYALVDLVNWLLTKWPELQPESTR
jgi:hypothetical protein